MRKEKMTMGIVIAKVFLVKIFSPILLFLGVMYFIADYCDDVRRRGNTIVPF